MITIGVSYRGDVRAGQRWTGYAKSQLAILLRQMELARPKPLNEGVRIVSPFPGVKVMCISSFGSKQVVIDVAQPRRLHFPVTVEKKKEFEYIKIFVHVDVINTESWYTKWTNDTHYEIWSEGDLLSRDMISSAVACGVINAADSMLMWEGVKIPVRVPTMEGLDTSTEYLAHNDLPPWNGIYSSTEFSTVEDVLLFYNDMFQEAPKYSPTLLYVPTVKWMTELKRTGDTTTISYGSCLEGTGPLTELGCYYSAAPPSGWCDNNEKFARLIDGEAYSFSSGPPSYITYSGNVIGLQETITWYDNYKLTVYEQYNDLPLVDCIQRMQVVARRDELIDDATFDDFNDGQYFYFDTIWYDYIKSPVFGDCWCFPRDYIYEQSYEPGEESQNWYVVREMLEHANNNVNTVYPYHNRRMLPFEDSLNTANNTLQIQHDYLCRFGSTLDMNYVLDDNFVWYCNIFGGNVAKLFRTSATPTECTYTEIRGLVNFNAITGVRPLPWDYRTGDTLNGTIRHLAEKAVVLAGGVVYENSTVPIEVFDPEKISIRDHLGVELPVDFKTEASGLLYSSPLFNVRVYAFPVR